MKRDKRAHREVLALFTYGGDRCSVVTVDKVTSAAIGLLDWKNICENATDLYASANQEPILLEKIRAL